MFSSGVVFRAVLSAENVSNLDQNKVCGTYFFRFQELKFLSGCQSRGADGRPVTVE